MGGLYRDSYYEAGHEGLTASATPRCISNDINHFIVRRITYISAYLVSVKQGLVARKELDCVAQLS